MTVRFIVETPSGPVAISADGLTVDGGSLILAADGTPAVIFAAREWSTVRRSDIEWPRPPTPQPTPAKTRPTLIPRIELYI